MKNHRRKISPEQKVMILREHLENDVPITDLIQAGARIRGTFTFKKGENNAVIRWYRRRIERLISRTYCSTGGFFSIEPVRDTGRVYALLQCG